MEPPHLLLPPTFPQRCGITTPRAPSPKTTHLEAGAWLQQPLQAGGGRCCCPWAALPRAVWCQQPARPQGCSPPQQRVPAPEDTGLPGGTRGSQTPQFPGSHESPGAGTRVRGLQLEGDPHGTPPHHLGWIHAASRQPGLEAGGGHKERRLPPGHGERSPRTLPQPPSAVPVSWVQVSPRDWGCHQLTLEARRA